MLFYVVFSFYFTLTNNTQSKHEKYFNVKIEKKVLCILLKQCHN